LIFCPENAIKRIENQSLTCSEISLSPAEGQVSAVLGYLVFQVKGIAQLVEG